MGSAENREECLFRCDSAGLGASPPEQSELHKSHFGPGSIVKAVSSLSLLVFGDSGWIFFENGTKLSAPPVWSTCVSVPARQTGRPRPLCMLPADTRPQGCSAGFQRPAILPGSPTAWPVHRQVSPQYVTRPSLLETALWCGERAGRVPVEWTCSDGLGRGQTREHSFSLVNHFLGICFPDHWGICNKEDDLVCSKGCFLLPWPSTFIEFGTTQGCGCWEGAPVGASGGVAELNLGRDGQRWTWERRPGYSGVFVNVPLRAWGGPVVCAVLGQHL